MDKQLFDTYRSLETLARDEVRYRLKDSPVGLRLLEFLDKCTNRNFRHQEVISFLYKDEEGNVPFTMLRNRYFKLRKKVIEEMSGSRKESSSGTLLTPEETELYTYREGNNNPRELVKQLADLEKRCWEKNLFELIPAVLDHMILLAHMLNKLDETPQLHKRMELALDLQHAAGRMLHLGRQVYEVNFRKGTKHAAPLFNEMHRIALKYRQYPRFIIAYHYVSLYYKLGSKDYVDNMQVISRHFKAFHKLSAQHPVVPFLKYSVDYLGKQRWHLAEVKAFYHYNQCEFEEAYVAMKELWGLVWGGDPLHRAHLNEALFINMLRIEVATGRYKEAFATAEKWVDYLRENNQGEATRHAYAQMAYIYVEGYPATRNANIDFYLRKLGEQLKILKKTNITNFYSENAAMRSRLHYIDGEYKEARKLIEDPDVKEYLVTNKLYDLYSELYKIPLLKKKEEQEAAKASFLKTLKKHLTVHHNPIVVIQGKWMRKMVGQ